MCYYFNDNNVLMCKTEATKDTFTCKKYVYDELDIKLLLL